MSQLLVCGGVYSKNFASDAMKVIMKNEEVVDRIGNARRLFSNGLEEKTLELMAYPMSNVNALPEKRMPLTTNV